MDEFMAAAIDEAKKGLKEGGIPIGCVLVKNGKIIGRGHNMRVQKKDPIMHAEINCIQNAGRIGNYRGAILYSTLMPCYLCAGAIVQFGIMNVIVGDSKTFKGAKKFMESHYVQVIDLDNKECFEMMKSFIKNNPDLWNEDIGK